MVMAIRHQLEKVDSGEKGMKLYQKVIALGADIRWIR